MIIFHVVFWALSVVFAYQLYIIRKEQGLQQKKDFFLTKKVVSDNVDIDDALDKVNKHLTAIEENIISIVLNRKNE